MPVSPPIRPPRKPTSPSPKTPPTDGRCATADRSSMKAEYPATKTATAALRELRRAQPNVSLAWIASQMPIQQDADREHYLEAFRRAGLD